MVEIDMIKEHSRLKSIEIIMTVTARLYPSTKARKVTIHNGRFHANLESIAQHIMFRITLEYVSKGAELIVPAALTLTL